MQFLWKYVEDLVGKGLEWYVIVELLVYASASLVTMALPLAILLSSIMTFGNLGENYELVAMKSAGISLQRIMRPLIIFSIILSGIAFYFSNSIWPIANLKFKRLLYDINHTKPALDLKPSIFYKEIDNYVIRISSKGEDNETLNDVIIYDHSESNDNRKVIKANSGKMFITGDQRFMVLELYDGYQYDEMRGKNNPLLRSDFEKHTIRMELTGFNMNETDESLWKSHYQMMNVGQLNVAIDSLDSTIEQRVDDFVQAIDYRMIFLSDTTYHPDSFDVDTSGFALMADLESTEKVQVYSTAINLSRANKTYAASMQDELKNRFKTLNRYIIEWHRKFTLSVACLVLFFVGAPLGAIIRKGGLGMPVVVSVMFFLIWHITSITGEKLVKQGEMSGISGMWMATVLLTPIGIFLTYKATTDSVLLDSTFYNRLLAPIKPIIRLINKLARRKHKESDDA